MSTYFLIDTVNASSSVVDNYGFLKNVLPVGSSTRVHVVVVYKLDSAITQYTTVCTCVPASSDCLLQTRSKQVQVQRLVKECQSIDRK